AGGRLLLRGATRPTPGVTVAAALFAAGFGLGLFRVPNMAAVMGAFPAGQQGGAGGLAMMARTLGIVAGVATLSQVFATWRASGFEAGFTAAVVGAGGGGVVAPPGGRCLGPGGRWVMLCGAR